MYEQNMREMVKNLYDIGKTKREISRITEINIKTVRSILKEESNHEMKERMDKIQVNDDLLNELYNRCNGYAQRVYEILKDEHKLNLSYSTVTRLLKQHGIGRTKKERCEQYPDIPGEEMQQDTSVYIIAIGDKKVKVVCSGLYFRYSKMRYVKFYYRFNRFKMKCFFHEALMYFGYTAARCIIDNTNLAVYSGTGENAVFSNEMLKFSMYYGFKWKAHRIRHPNRKAGMERNFFSLETNFFPGRSFNSLDDLNNQAYDWACNRFANRPLSLTKLIPIELFEVEKNRLIKLNQNLMPPYLSHNRLIDQYGYIAFNGNYYWVPDEADDKKNTGRNVLIIEYPDKINIYQNHRILTSYPLPDDNVRNKKIVPENLDGRLPNPKNIRKRSTEEESALCSMDDNVKKFLDFIKSKDCKIGCKPKFIRELYALSKNIQPSLFVKGIERALIYKIENIDSIQRIISQLLKNESIAAIEIMGHNDYQNRKSYQLGLFSEENDLNEYQKMIDKNDDL